MSDIVIRIRDNGPLLVRGGATVTDSEGNTYESKDTIALCRCGHSAMKPFCDASHKAQDFQSAPRAGQ